MRLRAESLEERGAEYPPWGTEDGVKAGDHTALIVVTEESEKLVAMQITGVIWTLNYYFTM